MDLKKMREPTAPETAEAVNELIERQRELARRGLSAVGLGGMVGEKPNDGLAGQSESLGRVPLVREIRYNPEKMAEADRQFDENMRQAELRAEETVPGRKEFNEQRKREIAERLAAMEAFEARKLRPTIIGDRGPAVEINKVLEDDTKTAEELGYRKMPRRPGR